MTVLEDNQIATADADTNVDVVLTIAGSDSSGGAGIQVDLKSFTSLSCYGASVITAVTAQNTTGVQAVHVVPSEIVAAQLDAVLEDLPIKSVKIGMVGSEENAAVIASRLADVGIEHVVLDTPLISGTGSPLGNAKVRHAVRDTLFPLASLITPNLAEAGMFLNEPPASSVDEMVCQAKALLAMEAAAVLLKGGHLGERGDDLPQSAVDVFVSGDVVDMFEAPFVDTVNTHGTGCALSSAIAAYLAKGEGLSSAIRLAKAWLTEGLKRSHSMNFGHGPGPVNLLLNA